MGYMGILLCGETLKDGDLTLFSCPTKIMERAKPWDPLKKVDGVSYQWMYRHKWIGQGYDTTFDEFERNGPCKEKLDSRICDPKWLIEPPGYFDWLSRVGGQILDLPFIEGVPTPEKAKIMTAWVKENSDLYKEKYVKLYHATAMSLPIEHEGLKPTSTTRRRSYQSTSGYVYLAATPERAKNFGDIGNQGRSAVYEVIALVRNLLSDRDQLNNQRAVGQWGDMGNSIGESIVYGGGVRIKGAIEPWAVRKMEALANEAQDIDAQADEPDDAPAAGR